MEGSAGKIRVDGAGGQTDVTDLCVWSRHLVKRLPACRIASVDKRDDTDAIPQPIAEAQAAPSIPSEVNRCGEPCFSFVPYCGRNAIERMFGRLKGLRRIATRFDYLATNHLAAVCLAPRSVTVDGFGAKDPPRPETGGTDLEILTPTGA